MKLTKLFIFLLVATILLFGAQPAEAGHLKKITKKLEHAGKKVLQAAGKKVIHTAERVVPALMGIKGLRLDCKEH